MDILPNTGERPRIPNGIISQEEANELMIEALDAQQDEPEQLVKMLVILYDSSDGFLQEAVYRLMRAAYNSSLVHSFSLQDYIAIIREGRDPLKEARTRDQEKQGKVKSGAIKRSKKKPKR